jgi:hypothetical protein
MNDEWFTNKNFLFRIFVLQTKKLTPPFLSHKGKVCGRPPQNKTKQEEEDAKKKE